MQEFNFLQLDQNEVNEALKEYVIKKGFTPKKGAVFHMTKNGYGISSGAKINLEKEIQEEK